MVEWTRARVAIRRVVAPAPQSVPAGRLRSATHDVSFLRSESRCRRYVSDLSNVTPRYLDSEQKGRVSLLYLTLSEGFQLDAFALDYCNLKNKRFNYLQHYGTTHAVTDLRIGQIGHGLGPRATPSYNDPLQT